MSNDSAAAEKAAQQNKEMNEYIRSKVVSGRIEVKPLETRPNASENQALRATIAAKQQRMTSGGQ